MHRNRTWSFVSPLWRLNHNRIINADGYISPVDFMKWLPFDVQFLSTLTVLGPIRDPITITGTYQPIKLKWNLISGAVPRSVLLYYRKNGGAWVLFSENVFTTVTFSDGDVFQLGASTGNSIGTFLLALFNDADGLQCSQPLTINVV